MFSFKKEELLYATFFYYALIAALVDKIYVTDKHKGKYGACIGITALIGLCGWEVVFPLVNIIVNTAIIFFYGKRAGVINFSFTLAYLFYFRCFCSTTPITNMFMMSTTMKMISAAMESSTERQILDGKFETNLPYSFCPKNIIFYALHYIGLIGVPFYTFKTYCEYINLPLKNYPSEWKYKATICLVDSFIFILLKQFLNYLWPLSYVSSDEFYDKRSVLFRIWYIYPINFDFILRIGNAFIMMDACCYISGLGAYPDFTKPKCGHGPIENTMKMSMLRQENLHKYKFSYETINNVNFKKVFFSTEFKQIIKNWNRTIQYWLYRYVYITVPYKFLKKPATMIFSSYWHGIHVGYIWTWFFVSLALYIEKRWDFILRGRISQLK
ncbi:lysophospholipid acyltransferase 7-like isoform X2 [Coccinella septempunctata]|uniref:lysophospholipid acyltransferase 7-like isoform X2 n=1 Tax=Coccinella septempunctata TaxID=41139 RepID=UPI001D0819D1|nr:lysophospholipid acyltransferase 7-like isoform X2 [Coccinella septempunctata]